MRKSDKLLQVGVKVARKLRLHGPLLRLLRKNKAWILKAVGEGKPATIETTGHGACDVQTNLSSQLIANMLQTMAKEIPTSNGTAFFEKIPLNIGIITDVYMFNFYKDTFRKVTYLTPTNYRKHFDNGEIEVFFYVSCWKGIADEEWRGVKFRKEPLQAMEEILRLCKRNNVPTIFQTIEDPSNFEYFLPLAVKFDHIFTSDAEMVDKYKSECGHERVHYGEYGVNPLLNNPIGCRRLSLNSPFFAGSYPRRYQERCDDMDVLFDSIVATGESLVIADRNFGTTADELKYPARFEKFVIPPIGHEILQSVHKLFRYSLNFNSIKDSPTMCAMRVYELQAQGKGVLSNYANSLFNKFPSVRIVPCRQDLSHEINGPETIDEYRLNMKNVRNVLDNKTSFDVLSAMLASAGIKLPAQPSSLVCVICANLNDKIEASFARQHYVNKILLTVDDIRESGGWESVVAKEKIRFAAWFSSGDYYDDHYLGDMINCFKFTNSSFVTKLSYYDRSGAFINGPQHEYTNIFGGREKSVVMAEAETLDFLLSQADGENVFMANGYAADPFEFNNTVAEALDKKFVYELSVIIPVFNNGRFLIDKCIPSLRRNKLWNNFEILLIDDGSTDPETVAICENLAKLISNITYYAYKDGGSGSASRPRNKGLELASAPLVSFLDPDNEISPGGYDELVDIYKEAQSSGVQVDFVSGYHVKVTGRSTVIGKHSSVRSNVCSDFYAAFFSKGKFPVISTQAAVISNKLFSNSEFRFVEQAAGQDTLFGWELLCRSNVGIFTNSAHLLYYAEREGSVTNTVDIRYFKKKLILEREQVKMLKKSNLFELYVDCHFEQFMEGWYLPKLKMVSPKDMAGSKALLSEIVRLYGRKPEKYGLDN